ncbi:hypothetical protein NADE_008407 [Nannochloris sp. 'desiccata']|nr:hypothetical protein NADE_008407 [Chlorella desiccata (nom. nud.)]
MNIPVLLACILAVGIVDPVQARELQAVQCAVTDASCWCSAKGITGTFPDPTSSCTKYYECVSPVQNYYRSCPSGTAFSAATKRCDWSEEVICSGKDTGPTTTVILKKPPPPSKRRRSPPPPPARRRSPPPSRRRSPPPLRRRSPPPPRRRSPPPLRRRSPPPPRRRSPPPPRIRSPPPPRKRPSPPPSTVSPSPSPSVIFPSPPRLPSPIAPSGNTNSFVGYFQSWSDPWSSSAATNKLANIPAYVNYVILSFMRPDSTYTGGVTFSGTGLDFSSDPLVIKSAIALLKARNPNTKVLIAVGGATYTAFNNLNAGAVAKFVEAFNLDGVDLDYEPTNPNCSNFGPNISCTTDSEYINSVKALRAALPRPLLLTNAAWSTGAYGQGEWIGAQPAGQYSGVAVNMLQSVGNQLDMVHIMSYDAGTAYDPKQAFFAYTSLYDKNKLTMGLQVAPEAWGGHVISLYEVNDLSTFVKAQNGAGMMMWSLQKQAGEGPTGQEIASTACLKLGLNQCSCPLLSTQPC